MFSVSSSTNSKAQPVSLAPVADDVAVPPVAQYGIGERELQRIAADIDSKGYAVLENFLTADEVASVQDFITGKVAEAGNQYVGLIGREAAGESLLGKVSDAPGFNQALRRLYELDVKKPAPNQGLYQVVRCLRGETGAVHSFYFHYDSYVVTALIPIHIPKEGQTGDLVLSDKRRPLRSSYILNVIDKVLINNKIGQRWLKWLAQTNRRGFKHVKMVPGNIYFFWGSRTIHANEPCDINQIRATALFHFGDLYAGNSLRKVTGKAQYRAQAEAPSSAEPA